MGSTQQQRLEEALLREIERLTQLPPDCFERLQICGTFPEIVSKMGLLEAWRFLRRVKSQDGESGLTNWLLGWILGRRALVREANLQLALALNRTFGCERYHVLLEAGRLGRDVDSLQRAADIAKQQAPTHKSRLLKSVVSVLFRMRCKRGYRLALSLTEDMCRVSSDPNWWERRGKALVMIGDDFGAREAFLKAWMGYSKTSDLSRIQHSLATVAKFNGDLKGALEHGRKALRSAESHLKPERFLALARIFISRFDYRAASYVYPQAQNCGDYEPLRLADIYFRTGMTAKALAVLSKRPSSVGASIFYQLGHFVPVRKMGTDFERELVETEDAEPESRRRMVAERSARALQRLPEPCRSLVESRLNRKDLCLHPRTAFHEIRQIRIRPVLLVAKKEAQARYLCDKIIQSLLDFHQGEFGPWIAPPIVDEFRTIKVERGLFGPRSQSEWQTRMTQLELELGIRPVKRNQIVLVFHRPPFEGCVFRGFAHKSHRIFHIWTSESRFVDKVAVHEFYHACLQLEHSHGLDAPDDPRCLMTQGERALKTCYLHPFHKACCLTPRTVQRKIHKSLRAVESGRWNETVATLTDAFAEDPLHHWLARQLAAVLFRVNRFKEASEVLRRHFKYSPTREAKAVLLDALAFTGNISEAKKLQQKWPRGGSPMEETMALLIAWKGAGYYRFALKVAEENLSRCGYSSGLYFEIGDLRWRMQQRRAAEQAFLETIRRGHTRVYNCLSLIKSELGDHVQARAYFELGRAEFFDEQACYLEMRLALAQGLWDEAKVQIEQVGGKPEWARGYKVVLCYLEDGSESPALKELETFGLSLEWGWFAMVWRSFLNGEPDVGLLKSGYRLFGLNPCWNLARYLVMGIEIPPHYFHQTIRDRIRGERT